MELCALRDRRDLIPTAARWFHEKWGVPEDAYLESMTASGDRAAIPQWYVALEAGEIVGGVGAIENDFHDRPDLAPNLCAVYVEPPFRGRGLAGRLLRFATDDLARFGLDTLYLLTDHVGFYERYGWEFFCMAQGRGDEAPSRLYRWRRPPEA